MILYFVCERHSKTKSTFLINAIKIFPNEMRKMMDLCTSRGGARDSQTTHKYSFGYRDEKMEQSLLSLFM